MEEGGRGEIYKLSPFFLFLLCEGRKKRTKKERAREEKRKEIGRKLKPLKFLFHFRPLPSSPSFSQPLALNSRGREKSGKERKKRKKEILASKKGSRRETRTHCLREKHKNAIKDIKKKPGGHNIAQTDLSLMYPPPPPPPPPQYYVVGVYAEERL